MTNLHSLVLEVETYTYNHLDRYVEDVREFCSIDSATEYKLGLDQAATYLATYMHRLGMQVTISENNIGGNDVVGTLRGEGHGKIVLLGHSDTVYPYGTALARPLRMEGNILYAPGACDMKGCIISALYTIEALLATGYRDFGDIHFLCVSDEETSHRHSEDLIAQICQGSQAIFVLEAARSNGDIVSARKGTAWYTLQAAGRSAHAGVEPEKGRNAVIEIAHQILQFASISGEVEGLSICPGVMSGGTTPNVVPDSAMARFDLRYLRSLDRKTVERRWHELLKQKQITDVTLTLELEAYRDPMVSTSKGLQLAALAQKIAGILGFSLNHVLSGGTSDGRYASMLGVPVLDGLGPIGGLDHSPHEYLLLDSVAPRAALLAGLLAEVSVEPQNFPSSTALAR